EALRSELPDLARDDEHLRAHRTAIDAFAKHLHRLIDLCIKDLGARRSPLWKDKLPALIEAFDNAHAAVQSAVQQHHYFHRQLLWLLHRFPEGVYQDVPGLCKIASRADIAAADWSLTPGRHVGVAPAEVDEDFDFGQAMRDIHGELKDLDREASELAAKIQANLEGLGI
ncbi:MAG: hypothetical protein Q8M07_19100, partial [Prosthecobacter sp.]|nr:hypothetical protein [Prosthecobacter sp.]